MRPLQAPLAFAAFALTACASSEPAIVVDPEPTFGTVNAPESVDFHAGARLAPRAQQAQGGAALLAGWYDTKLTIPCSFRLADDRKIRCLPTSAGTAFASADCTHPVITRSTTTCGTVPGLVSIPATGCGNAATVRRVGPRLASASHNVYSRDTKGVCKQAPLSQIYAYDLYEVGDAVDAQSFVAQAETTRDARGAEYFVQRIHTDDGAWWLSSIFVDAARNQLCSRVASQSYPPDIGAMRCLPLARAGASFQPGNPFGFYADSGCTSAVASSSACAEVPALVTVQKQMASCSSEWSMALAQVGAPIFTRYAGDTCTAFPADASARYYAVGAPIPIASFPTLSLSHEGDARIGLQTVVTPSGERMGATGNFYDNERKVPCSARLTADGVVRCIPPQTSAYAYADSACTQALVVSTGCALHQTVAATRQKNASGCGTVQRFYSIGPEQTVATPYQLTSDGQCVPYSIQSKHFFSTVEIPPAAFAPLVAVVTDMTEDADSSMTK